MRHVRIAIGAVLLFAVTSVSAKTYRFTHIFGDIKIPQDIMVDKASDTVLITVGDVSRYPGHVSTLNLHDFDTGYVAFKDIRKGICLLSKAPVDGPQEDLYAKRTTNFTMAFDTKIDTYTLEDFVVDFIAGGRIADFCQDYNTHFMELIPKDLKKPTLETVTGHCHHNCFHCVLWTNCDLYESLL